MKRFLSIFWIVILGACVSSYAQRTQYVYEAFDSGRNTAALAENWDMDASKAFLNYLYMNRGTEAGGESPEAIIGYYPDYGLVDMLKGSFLLVSKPHTTQAGPAYVTLKYSYVANKESAADNRSFNILARKDGGEWMTCASVETFPTEIPASVLCARLPETFENAGNVQIAVEVVSSRDGVRFIFFIDDIAFFSLPSGMQAAELKTLTSSNVFDALETMQLKLTNVGNVIERSGKVSYRWNGGEVYTKAYDFDEPVGIDASVVLDLQPEGWDNAVFGASVFEAWVSEIDGTAMADATHMTTAFYHIDEADMFPKKLLVEEFSSATCSPCATMNQRVFNPVFDTLGLDVVLVKYQMNWPGSGDKYYTVDGAARRDYYGVSSVPCLVVEGQEVNAPSTAERFLTYMRDRMANAGKTLVKITFDTLSMDSESKILTLAYSVRAVGVLNNVKLQTVVVEKETTGNRGSNGERSFHHVMMTMVPSVGEDANTGLSLDLKPDTVYTFSYRIDMGKTNMEEPDDLMVACFIQNADHSVEQAAIRQVSDGPDEPSANESQVGYTPLAVYPNPASEEVTLPALNAATVEVFNMAGRRVFRQYGAQGDYRLDVRNFRPGTYVIRVVEAGRTAWAKINVVR